MNCHICANPAAGQCQVCWKFYCADHGDRLCQPCQSQRGTTGAPAGWEPMGAVMGQPRSPRSSRVDRPPDIEGQPLQRVIGVGQTVCHGDTEVVLVSLELYADGSMVSFRLRKTPPDEPRASPVATTHHPEFSPEAADDLGNKFQVWPHSGSGGGDRYWRAAMRIHPELPAQAKNLRITITEVRWLARGSGVSSVTEPGPWEFDVSLE
ncbi:MAG: hypothetical protein IIA92_13550 [Chloroflexi bacterium]|nr:hypothetical protein [Chloroflexota bacterium]